MININRASFEDLLALNGIGEDLAQKILENRKAQGPFASVSDLTRVSGLGEKKLDMFREVITTED
ncbi:ComEA family DNA-binding protein [Salisediminibacterium selenitireducens]|uniref:ComEA family DNA-binding protein n=1 Tax=Salisediminibacterium selenitireducens TaxID=85683 RepID=UPI00067460BE|nr:helix-hairpin-helix domain-containing protein [Salisediminibacterium selenitireducens]